MVEQHLMKTLGVGCFFGEENDTNVSKCLIAFNQPISNWDTSSVSLTWTTCFVATLDSFNQDIGDWNTSSVNSYGLHVLFNAEHLIKILDNGMYHQ